MGPHNQKKAYVYAVFTVLFWSTVASAFKIALREYHPIEMLFVANLVSLLIFTGILMFRRKPVPREAFSFKYLSLSALQGLLNPFLYYLVLFRAYSMLPAQVAQPVNFIWPIMLMILSVPLLRQKIKLSGLISLLVSFIGVIILSSQGNILQFSIPEPAGVGLALFSSVIWALYWIVNMKDRRDDILKLFTSFMFSFIYITIVAAFTRNLTPSVSHAMLASVYIGIFEMGITFIVWLKALRLSESTVRISNLIYLTPFLSLVCIYFVLHENLHITSVLGLFLIVAGIVIQQLKKGS